MKTLITTLAFGLASSFAFAGPGGGTLTVKLTDENGKRIEKKVAIDECRSYSTKELQNMVGVQFSDYADVAVELNCDESKSSKGDQHKKVKVVKMNTGDTEFSEEKLAELLEGMDIDIEIDLETLENGEWISEDGKKMKIIMMEGEDGKKLDIDEILKKHGIYGKEGEMNMIKVDVNTETSNENGEVTSETVIETDQGGEVKVLKFSGEELSEEEIQKKLKEMGIDIEQMKSEGGKVITKTIRIELKVDDASKEEIQKVNKKGGNLNTSSNILTMDKFALSPNPSNGNMKVRAQLASEAAVNIMVYAMNGELVMQKNGLAVNNGNLEFDLNLDEQESGIYLIQFEQNGKVATKKAIIK